MITLVNLYNITTNVDGLIKAIFSSKYQKPMELYDHFKILNKKINFMWSEKRVDKERVKSTYHINKTIIENTPYIKIGNEDIYNHPNLKLPSKSILIKDNTHLLSLIHVNNWQYDTYITSPILIHVTHDNSNYIMFIDRDNNMKFHNAFQHLYLTKKQIEFSTQILDEFSKNNSEIINQYLKTDTKKGIENSF